MEVTIIINIVVMEIIITILVDPILIAKVQPVPNLGGINLPHHLGTYLSSTYNQYFTHILCQIEI